MTPFRRNLEQLRRDYRADRYPGDLAADLLDSGKFSPDEVDAASATERSELLDGGFTGGPIPITRGSTANRWRTMFVPLLSTAALAAAFAVGATLAVVHFTDRSDSATGPVAVNVEPTTTPTEKKMGVLAVKPDANAVQTDTTDGVASNTVSGGNGGSSSSGSSTATDDFTVVPTIVAVVGEDYSLVPSAPSFDFSLSASADDGTAGSEMADN